MAAMLPLVLNGETVQQADQTVFFVIPVIDYID